MKLVGWRPTGTNYRGIDGIVISGHGRRYSKKYDKLEIYSVYTTIFQMPLGIWYPLGGW
jgi:hypothetical protein